MQSKRIALVLLLLASLPATLLADKLKTYADRVHKFSLARFADWEQVPTEVGNENEVVKFYEPGNKGDVFTPTLAVVRVQLAGGEGAPVTGVPANVDPESIPKEYRALLKPKSAWRLTMDVLRPSVTGDRADRSKLKPKKVRSADGVEGKLWVYEVPLRADHSPEYTLYAVLTEYEKDGIEYGIFLTASKRRGERFLGDFKRISKSFTFFDKHAQDLEVESISALDGVNISPKRRVEIEAGLVKGWKVIVSPKKNYVVVYNTKGNKNHQLAKVIGERIEKLREQVYEIQFPPTQPIDAVSIVRVCADAKEYHAYGGPGGSAGYWNSGTEELVFYDASPSKKIDDDTVSVLYHEAFHQYIFYSVGSVAPHSWFNEGHGDYYAGAEYNRGRFKIAPFDWRLGKVKDAIREGPRPFSMKLDEKTQQEIKVWENKGYTPLADLVNFTQSEYYSYPGVSYAQGWSLIYFLREGLSRKQREQWGHILPTYFDTLKAEVARSEGLKPGSGDDPSDPDDPPDPDNPGPPNPPAEPDGDPGDSGDPGDEGDEEGDPLSEIPPVPSAGLGSEAAKLKAIEAAFKGVDLEQLEKAWLESTLKVN